MTLRGYCEVQNKEYEIDVHMINATCHDDNNNKRFIQGRIECEFASRSDLCNAKECSILKQAR
jgi:hypothetical protein